MNRIEVLRGIVARLGGVSPSEIGPNFSLQTSALKGSIKRAALAASIRRDLGVNCPTAHALSTFGELEAAVVGVNHTTTEPAAATGDVSPTASSRSSAPVISSGRGGVGEVRCGIDLEAISELPEASDYREHQFYKDSFTAEEIAYCLLQDNPRMHLAARWCAKEALFKCDPAFRGEKMSNVEVARSDSGEVFLRQRSNGSSFVLPHSLSLSHTNTMAAAVVVMAANGPAGPAVEGNAVPTSSLANGSGSISGTPNLPSLWIVMACLVSVGLALLAFLRTFH